MKKVLKIDASARSVDNEVPTYRSLSRLLSRYFLERWLERNSEDLFIHRDVGATPPAFVSQDWIAAVFTPEAQRSAEQRALLALSDQLIDEVTQADLILISTPMYNYGMPASLKAWFDQVVRVNKTFSFDLARGDFPLQPILSGKTLVLLSSSGEFGFEPGGVRESMNHLGPHVRTLGHYLGVEDFYEIRIEYQEFGDERHRQSIENAYREVDKLVETLTGKVHSMA
ncbi:FMN-dependent NADH-azoreductase [Microbulbifer donghaiensis]|uniref:FMN dependent NADH:quinone oxidoreductase n=1 Tax=Microbulbifer donghaiensis TaxID=494016 RepID=A0A1M4ZMX6_9GAMM|nr:NAD(P)H-dependent oxidoreductase [Microbulbifer donghaiensis]SHF19393.1 FMN-dependent NADH-azoreductase [Microbulbifer donghaiensis]